MGKATVLLVCLVAVSVLSWDGQSQEPDMEESDNDIERMIEHMELSRERRWDDMVYRLHGRFDRRRRRFDHHREHDRYHRYGRYHRQEMSRYGRYHHQEMSRYYRPRQAPQAKNIVQIAMETPDLSTLVTAVTAAGLGKTLSGTGPFTVFAPTNKAFSMLPPGTVEHLLRPENLKELQAVLTYHVLAAAVESKDLKEFQDPVTVEGQRLEIRVQGGKVYVGDGNIDTVAQVTTADVIASNGVVHIIDRVLIPPRVQRRISQTSRRFHGQSIPQGAPTSPIDFPEFAIPQQAPVTRPQAGDETQAAKNIVEIAAATPDLSTLVAAVKAGGLVDTLESPGPFTVFAPTNEAFAMLPPGTIKHLLEPQNKKELVAILTYHVVSGAIRSNDLKPEQRVKTVEGQELEIRVRDGKVYVGDGGARVTTANVIASNGVVHIINKVLIPPRSIL